jgi:hypothetical protein
MPSVSEPWERFKMNCRQEAVSLLRQALALLDQEHLHLAAAHTAQAMECLASSLNEDDAGTGEPSVVRNKAAAR